MPPNWHFYASEEHWQTFIWTSNQSESNLLLVKSQESLHWFDANITGIDCQWNIYLSRVPEHPQGFKSQRKKFICSQNIEDIDHKEISLSCKFLIALIFLHFPDFFSLPPRKCDV